jgi:hypothetical protein
MSFMWKFVIGWDEKEKCGRDGIFGKAEAACETDEEQGRKTLHSHWLIWVKDFNFVRNMCYHEDDEVREKARLKLNSYVEKVMCASFGSKYDVSHVCKDDVVKTDEVEAAFEPLSDQTVRDARHRDHCFSVCGEFVGGKTEHGLLSGRHCCNGEGVASAPNFLSFASSHHTACFRAVVPVSDV